MSRWPRGREGSPLARGLREHVRPHHRVAGDSAAEGVHVDDVSREIDERAPGFAGSNSVRPIRLVLDSWRHVHGDDVGFAPFGLHGGHLCGVAQGERSAAS